MMLHILRAEAAEGDGGVSDYTKLLVAGLEHRGATVRCWDPSERAVRGRLATALMSDPGRLLVQYVPNALGRRGANLGSCLWLLALRRRGVDVRVMFHEPYMYFSGQRPLQAVLAVIQRVMAATLLRASPVSYVSTEQWRRYLSPYASRRNHFIVLPIPATIPVLMRSEETRRWRERLAPQTFLLGHFGTYGEHVRTDLVPMVTRILREREDVRFVCIGRGSEAFVAALAAAEPGLAGNLAGTGALDGQAVADVLRACDLVLQPYPDGVTTRRTSVMAPLACGVATVTSRGFLTEPIWERSQAVRLAPASDAAAHVRACLDLLEDEPSRRVLASRALQTYAQAFAMERTLDLLLKTDGAPA